MHASLIGLLLGATTISGLIAGATMAETASLNIRGMSGPYAADVGPGGTVNLAADRLAGCG